MTRRRLIPFAPNMPNEGVAVAKFASDTVDFLNRPNRNEFTVPVGCRDAIEITDLHHVVSPVPYVETATHVARLTFPGWSPYLDGYRLRRVRIARPESLGRASGTVRSSILVRVLVSSAEGRGDVVGTFDQSTMSLTGNVPRLISASADIDWPLRPSCVVLVECSQMNWPKTSCKSMTVFLDIGIT